MAKITEENISNLKAGDIIINHPYDKNLSPHDISNFAFYQIINIPNNYKSLTENVEKINPFPNFLLEKKYPFSTTLDGAINIKKLSKSYDEIIAGDWHKYIAI